MQHRGHLDVRHRQLSVAGVRLDPHDDLLAHVRHIEDAHLEVVGDDDEDRDVDLAEVEVASAVLGGFEGQRDVTRGHRLGSDQLDAEAAVVQPHQVGANVERRSVPVERQVEVGHRVTAASLLKDAPFDDDRMTGR